MNIPTGPDTWLVASIWPAFRAVELPVKKPAKVEPRPFNAVPKPLKVATVKSFITPADTIGADQVERRISKPLSAEYGATPRCGEDVFKVMLLVNVWPLRLTTTFTVWPESALVVSLSFFGLSILTPLIETI